MEQAPSRLSVVVLNWKAHKETRHCLRQLATWSSLGPSVWVVDNGSPRGEAVGLARSFPGTNVLRAGSNLGFGGGSNLGIAEALEASHRPILLLNNDAEIAEGDVATLLDDLESHADTGILGPVLYDAAERSRILSAGSRSPVLTRRHSLVKVPESRKPYEVHSISGAVALIDDEVFRRVGLLDEAFFFGLEMTDLCQRARRAGLVTRVDPRAAAYHDIGRSSRRRETLYVYYVVRNRFLLLRKHHRWSRPLLALAWGAYGAQQAWRLRRQARVATARAIELGVADGVRGRFGGQNERLETACASLRNALSPTR